MELHFDQPCKHFGSRHANNIAGDQLFLDLVQDLHSFLRYSTAGVAQSVLIFMTLPRNTEGASSFPENGQVPIEALDGILHEPTGTFRVLTDRAADLGSREQGNGLSWGGREYVFHALHVAKESHLRFGLRFGALSASIWNGGFGFGDVHASRPQTRIGAVFGA